MIPPFWPRPDPSATDKKYHFVPMAVKLRTAPISKSVIRDVSLTVSKPHYLKASGTCFAPRDSRSDPPGRRSHEPSGSQIHRGRTPAFMRRRPRWVARCSVHVSLSKPPQPATDTPGAGVPEQRIGSEALEASAKLRISSVDCVSAASFGAARSEQLRLPAEEPLERRDGSSCKSRVNPSTGLGSRLIEPHFS